ncbi:MAG: hypothetical protein ACXV5A_08215 [Halobacteriota archaeon]
MTKETLGRFIGDAIYFPICNRCERYNLWGHCDIYPEQIPHAVLAGYADCTYYVKHMPDR